MRPALALLALFLARPSAAEPDWAAATQEASEHLSRLVRIDTVNPPGMEKAACDYIAKVLAREKIPYEILESSPGRANIIARIKGDGSRKPLLLLSHLDTVGVEKGEWTFPPFSGAVVQGTILGRGSIDDKSMAAAGLEALLLLRREGAALKRDVIYAAVADEESGGRVGVIWLLDRHPGKIAAEYAINEGGTSQLEDGKVRLLAVESLEKRYYDIRMTAHGTSGHAAIRHPDNALYSLARALSNLDAWQPAIRLNPVTRAYFTGVLPLEVGRLRRAIEDVLSDETLRQARGSEALRTHPYYHATLHDTVVPTVIGGGIRENVTPAQAWVNLNVRLLPDTDPDQFLESLRKAVDEPGVELTVVSKPKLPPAPAMPLDNEFFSAFRRTAARLSPGAVVVPSMAVGSTDSEALRRRGIATYGFEFPLSFEDESRIHGSDERMPVESLGYGVRFYYELIKELQ